MYDFYLTKKFVKNFKKLDRQAQVFIRHSIFPILQNDPMVGERLKGKEYKKFYKFGIRFKSVDCRIVYQIKNKELIIVFIMIASRENFYKGLRRRV